MFNIFNQKLGKLISKLSGTEKQDVEVRFWRNELQKYIEWSDGTIKEIYGNPTPAVLIPAYTKKLSALLTFFETHQIKKYMRDLQLEETAFLNKKVLDVGSGPFPSALCFKDAEVFCLDPLFDRYLAAGFPIHCYEQRARFVHAFAEAIPFEDNFFDAVISVNAIDHVDDFYKTAQELKRVLKPDGRFRMHVHYHPKTIAEPIELNDEIFLECYSWVSGLRKLSESTHKTGSNLSSNKESYVLWGNDI